jgi:hypothetical protein
MVFFDSCPLPRGEIISSSGHCMYRISIVLRAFKPFGEYGIYIFYHIYLLSTVCTYRETKQHAYFLTYGRYNTVWCKTSTVVYLPILLYGIFYKAVT